MPHVTGDRVKDTTTSTGTGNITVSGSAPTGFRTLSTVATADGDTLFIAIVGGAEWETSLATRVSANVYTRTTILASSNSGSAVSFAAGTKDVFLTLNADTYNDLIEDAPATSPSGALRLYREPMAGGSDALAHIDSNGIKTRLLNGFGIGGTQALIPTNGTTTFAANSGIMGGGAAMGTATGRFVTSTSLFTSLARQGFVSSASAGNDCGYRGIGNGPFFRGSVTGTGGYMVLMRFGISDAAAVSNARMFVGLIAQSSSIGNVEPTSMTNLVGVGTDAGDTTLRMIHNDASGTATEVDLGANFPANTQTTDIYELQLVAHPADTEIHYRVRRLNTGDVASGTLTTDLPVNTTTQWPQFYRNNGSTALAVGIDIFGYYGRPDWVL
jgi:hypothetical protein